MENNMYVSHIPSLTWNRLQMNAAPASLDAASLQSMAQTDLPSLTFEEAKEYLSGHADAQEPEKYIAGKVPIYHPQTFATGLGAEYDTALENSGAAVSFLVIDQNTGEKPVVIRRNFPGEGNFASAYLIHVKEGTAATVIFEDVSEETAKGTAAVSVKVITDKGASLKLCMVQLLGHQMTSFTDIGISQKKASKVELCMMNLGAAESFDGIASELMEDDAAFEGRVGYLALEDQKLDIGYDVVQRGRKTASHAVFDGVLDGRAQKSFKGTIDFRNGSSGSVGDETENVLLLGEDVVNKTLPVILCEEEDVEGAHGATIGRLDEDMLFYMASRGIDEKEAARIMIRARLEAIARLIPDEAVRADITEEINRRI